VWFTEARRVILTRQGAFALASPFQVVLSGAWGLRRQIYCWVLPVSARVLHASPLRRSLSFFHHWRLVFGFSAIVLCIPIVFPVQSVFVLLKFYWNFCWLNARSTIFYFESMR
jgi:hypothetical protein